MGPREDGVLIASGTKPNGETFENLVVVAAFVTSKQYGEGDFKRGDEILTSMGPGIMLDFCGESMDISKAGGGTHLDIFALWFNEPYKSMREGKIDMPVIEFREEREYQRTDEEILNDILLKPSETLKYELSVKDKEITFGENDTDSKETTSSTIVTLPTEPEETVPPTTVTEPTEPEETIPPTTEQKPTGPASISDGKKDIIDNLILEKMENDEMNYNEWVKPNIQEEPPQVEQPVIQTEPEENVDDKESISDNLYVKDNSVRAVSSVFSDILGREVSLYELEESSYRKYLYEDGTLKPEFFTKNVNALGGETKAYTNSIIKGYFNDEVMQAVENGNTVLVYMSNKDGQLYVRLDGLTEEGKVIVNCLNANEDKIEFSIDEFSNNDNVKLYYVFNYGDTLPTEPEETVPPTTVTEPTEPEETVPPTTEQKPTGPASISDGKKDIIDNLILGKMENDEMNYNEWVKPNIQEEPPLEEPPVLPKPTPGPTEPEQTIPMQPQKGTPDAIVYEAQNTQGTTTDSEYICTILRAAGYLSDEDANILKNYSIEELCGRFELYGWKRLENSEELQAGDIIIVKNGQEENVCIYAGNNKWYTSNGTAEEELNLSEDSTWYAYRPSIQ